MNTEWKTATKQCVGVGLALFWLFIFYISQPVLPILIISILVAFLLTPFVNLMEQKGQLPRFLAVLVAHIILFIIILFIPLLLSGPMMSGVNTLTSIDYVFLINNSVTNLISYLETLRTIELPIVGTTLDFSHAIDSTTDFLRATEISVDPISLIPSMETIVDYVQSVVIVTFGVAASVAGITFSWAVTIIVTIMSSIYMTLDGRRFIAYLLSLVPEAYKPEIGFLFKRLRFVWQSYIHGQTTLMIIIGVTTAFGNWMLGVPGAFTLGVLAGVFELLPYLGPFLAAIPAVMIALLQGSTYLEVSNITFALMVAGLYLLIQQLENALVIPRVLGNAVRLHPLVVTLGVVVGANVGGILGALVATPVIATGREIVGYLYAKMLGNHPYPPNMIIETETEPVWLRYGKLWLTWFKPKRQT